MPNINVKLEYWKNRLLDLGKRNRLINCPLPNDNNRIQRHSLLIKLPNPNSIWTMMSNEDETLSFPIPPNLFEDDDINADVSIQVSNIQTNQSVKETYKTLRSLMKKSKEFTEEKGLNALHLAFGFINWKENGTTGQELRSPLLLVPVKLSQEDLFSPIILSRSDDEVSSNYSLEQKLFSDFGIELPKINEETNINEYLEKVNDAVKALGWNVTNDVVQLSLFSFMKINMYRDLELHSEQICNNHIVRVLNGEVYRDGAGISDISNYNHDNVEPKEVFSVVDADSSQQDAILLAKRGTSFVLQGPPGTGKSQTITNIISELIADGKKVLFVSEKMAALEVVYKRLTKVGLAPFCLTLHSHNAKRREILDQLNESINMSRLKTSLQQDAYNELYKLKEVRSKLNQYSIDLHTPIEPLGKTIYQVNGYISQYENYRNIDFIQEGADNFTQTLLSQCESALEEVTKIISKSGYQQDNPWNGYASLQPPTYEFRQRFIVDADVLTTQINDGIALFSTINKILGTNKDWCLFEVDDLQLIYDCSNISPKVPVAWISLDLESLITSLNNCIYDLHKKSIIQDKSNKFNDDCIKIRSSIETNECISQKTSEITNNINDYNNAYNSHKILSEQVVEYTQKHIDAENKYSLCNESSKKESQLCDEMQQAWQLAQNEILKDFDENILALDINNMLSRYRVDYRSFFKRMGGLYKQDRKSILVNCKVPIKLTYEQGLITLNTINDVLNKKDAYEQQLKISDEANKLLASAGEELRVATKMLKDTEENLSNANLKLLTEQQNLYSAIDKISNEYQIEIDEKTKSLSTMCNDIGIIIDREINEDTDFVELKSAFEWCIKFKVFALKYSFNNGYIVSACENNIEIITNLKNCISDIKEWEIAITPNYNKFIELFDDNTKNTASKLPLLKLLDMVKLCNENFAYLEYLIDYRLAEKLLTDLGIISYLDKAKEIGLAADEIVPVFKKCFFRSWLDVITPRFSSIQDFRRLRQDERVSAFKSLDKSHMEISKAIVISKLIAKLPNFDAFSADGEIALLRREMAKQRKLMPTRLLIASLPNLLPALKPCVMMSPLSVSTYLGSSNFEFDTVIFDEASQVRTEDAIGAIFRAKQVIIAGDSKQLPPTDFFASAMSTSDEYEESEDGEVNDSGAYESLLEEAVMLPTQTLLWHYRSRHEHLIAFSNAKIYQGNLITFPSATDNSDGMGVEYSYVQGGTYDKGGKNGNRAEAARVVELTYEHFKRYPNRSLGIIAFGEIQQSAIQDALNEKRRSNPTFEHFFKDDNHESLFIKNLETVQGDERDTIILSIGYAPDVTGQFHMNFGPLSRDGGERRLNVAVTRARYNLKLVGSILPTDIAVERISGQGPKLLRTYIDFAINGINAILGETTADDNLWFDSPFEASVHQFLTDKGYNVTTQVGCSGYRIDMAVKHPKYSGRYAIGIECDGAMYHSARTARERDRLRQTVLEDMGWKIYRIWSTDWIKDRHTEGTRLLNAVEKAINDYREIVTTAVVKSTETSEFLNVSMQTVQESVEEGLIQKKKKLRSAYYGDQVADIPLRDIMRTMNKVIENDFGLNKSGLFKETALFGYGWERQGARIKDEFERAYSELIKQDIIEETSDGKLKIAVRQK